jgi:predicted transglutaminase-like cysteine proteinase
MGSPGPLERPFETLRSGRGDCEDYAIVKYLALLEAGIPENDVKIVVLKNAFPIEDHAVLAARVDSDWLILDNRTLTLVRDRDLTRAVRSSCSIREAPGALPQEIEADDR